MQLFAPLVAASTRKQFMLSEPARFLRLPFVGATSISKLMEVVIFGCGPMPIEPQFAVTAPGARTWQIARTAANAIAPAHALGAPSRIIVLGLEGSARSDGQQRIPLQFGSENRGSVEGIYIPLPLDQYRSAAETGVAGGGQLPAQPDAVIACASAQPYASGAAYAQRTGAPLWVDVFGDPLAEIQTQTSIYPDEEEANGQRVVHVWKLLLSGLLRGDAFSVLSHRQRYGLLGQLGTAGRLNQFTVDQNMVHTIPYALFPDELPPVSLSGPERTGATFSLLWSGSFNSWMDVDVLLRGFLEASRINPRLRLIVVGGRVPGYNDVSYERFVDGIRKAGAEGVVQLLDWQPLARMRALYATCDVGLSIDRFSYEALLGSRTRVVNFLAAGKPVLSTVVTEITEDLAREGCLLPFRVNDSEDLARAITDAASRQEELRTIGLAGRGYISSMYNAEQCGLPLKQWLSEPRASADRDPQRTNPLMEYWTRIRANLDK